MNERPQQPRLVEETANTQTGPVDCLGLTFENEDARRAHFTDLLRAKLKEPAFRAIEGFPIGSDEDILALSDPPYYTACPNPFLEEFIRQYGKPYDAATDTYRREPFAIDVSEGKTDAFYRAHGYHTKVPHLAIVPSILHYTQPGDLVFDGFCGSGMTGVAAQYCGAAPLSYRTELEAQWKTMGIHAPEWGHRRVVLNDLSPAATFIAYNYNEPFDADEFAAAGRRVLDELSAELGWMYSTLHTDGTTQGRINYTVWSEIFTCAACAGDVNFFESAFNSSTNQVSGELVCPHCGASASKELLDLQFETYYDSTREVTDQRPKRVPVLINYEVGSTNYEKRPNQTDLELLQRIHALPLPTDVPIAALPDMQMARVGRMQTTKVHEIPNFFLPRAAQALALLWRKASQHEDARTRNMLLFFVEQAVWGMSVLERYVPTHYSQVNQYLSGVLYVASQLAEVSPWYILDGKLQRLASAFGTTPSQADTATISTQSLTSLRLPENSIDYVFTDPPFGENIYYADLNFLVESWHRVVTNATPEAIIDRVRAKGLLDYQRLMQSCFEQYATALKPGRWITVVFHNSRNAVWNAIQEALTSAGFVVADVRTLDKQQGSYQQVTNGVVKQDLIISAYKPTLALEHDFALVAGSEPGAWDFVTAHLRQLPVFVAKDGVVEVIAERQKNLLFDRMVAFHVQRGITVPISAGNFYKGIAQRFPERDDMYFLPEQAVEYDKKRMTVTEVEQLSLLVTDESSSIQWLRQLLGKKPQSFQDLHPQFIREIAGWQKAERTLELSDILEQNFLRYDGRVEVPSQIHSYLSTMYHDLRKLEKDDPALRAEAKDRWYVPDANKQADLEKLREKGLLKEFEEYKTSNRKLRQFRIEAVRAGFKHAYQEKEYQTILDVAEKLPAAILEEDAKLLMFYDQAMTRLGK